jgi:Ser/Thr protein kinase RdoA (MazF antagonist)
MTAALDALVKQAIQRWGIADATPQLLKVRENAIYRVSLGDGRFAVLRIHRRGYHSEAALRSELEWMAFLRANEIPTPAPIKTVDGDVLVIIEDQDGIGPWHVDCLHWVEGRALGASGTPLGLSDDAATRIFSDLGRLVGRIHSVASQWRIPKSFTRHSWDFDAFFGSSPIWGSFESSQWLDAEHSRIVAAGAARAAAQLAAFGRTARSFGLIHADLVRENILIDDGSTHVIDFDDSGFGWYLYDIAVALYQNRREPNYRVIEAAIISGYRSQRRLADRDVAALPLFMTLRALALIGWWKTRMPDASFALTARRSSNFACEMVQEYLASA